MENTEKKTKDFKALTEEDKKFSEEIERQLRQLERLQTLTTYWRKKIGQSGACVSRMTINHAHLN
jgi:hypothetical protein